MQKIVVLDNGSSAVPYILIAFDDHRIVFKFILPIFYQKKNPIFIIIIFQVKCEFSPWTPCSKSCGGLGVQTQLRPVWEPHFNKQVTCVKKEVKTRKCQAPEPESCPGTFFPLFSLSKKPHSILIFREKDLKSHNFNKVSLGWTISTQVFFPSLFNFW